MLSKYIEAVINLYRSVLQIMTKYQLFMI